MDALRTLACEPESHSCHSLQSIPNQSKQLMCKEEVETKDCFKSMAFEEFLLKKDKRQVPKAEARNASETLSLQTLQNKFATTVLHPTSANVCWLFRLNRNNHTFILTGDKEQCQVILIGVKVVLCSAFAAF